MALPGANELIEILNFLNNGQVILIFHQLCNKIKRTNYIFPERLIKMLFNYITCIHINIMYKKYT